MTWFENLFINSRGQPISYKEKILYAYDKIKIPKICKILVKRISTNSEWRQAIILSTEGKLKVNKEWVKKGTILWEYTAREEVEVEIESKSCELIVRNAWEPGYMEVSSMCDGAAMIIEEIPNGKRYYCNDGHPDENFDDIVFEIIFLPVDEASQKKKNKIKSSPPPPPKNFKDRLFTYPLSATKESEENKS